MEKQLARIWEGVFDLDGIGVEDNFPELGGDSLLASQVISQVIHAFRVELGSKGSKTLLTKTNQAGSGLSKKRSIVWSPLPRRSFK